MKMFWITPNFPLSLERSIYARAPQRFAACQRERKKEHNTKETCIMKNELRRTIWACEKRKLAGEERQKKASKRVPHIKLSECFLRDSSTVKCDFWIKHTFFHQSHECKYITFLKLERSQRCETACKRYRHVWEMCARWPAFKWIVSK